MIVAMPRWDPCAEDRLRQAALELFLEHVHPGTQVGEREAVRLVLTVVPAGSESEFDAAVRDPVRGRDELGQLGRVAEGGGRDERSEPQLRGDRRERAQRAPRIERPSVRDPGDVQVVVGAKQLRDPVGFARARQRDPLGPRDALLALDLLLSCAEVPWERDHYRLGGDGPKGRKK